MRHRFADRARQDVSQLTSRRDAELDEDLAEVPLDRPRAEEQPCPDLRVGQPVAGQECDFHCCHFILHPSLVICLAVEFPEKGSSGNLAKNKRNTVAI